MKKSNNWLGGILIVILCSAPLFGQNIKVKKDKILYDKKEIAKIEKPYRNYYEISNLNGEKQFSVQFNGDGVENTEASFQWLTLKNADESLTTEIPYEILKTSFNVETIIVHLLGVKYKLFDGKGIPQGELEEFFATDRENLSDKYAQLIANAKEMVAQEEAKMSEINSRYNPKVGSDGTIYFGSQVVGRVAREPLKLGSNGARELTFYDLDGNIVSQVFSGKIGDGGSDFRNYDQQEWNYNIGSYSGPDDLTYVRKALIILLVRDYQLGHQIRNEASEMHQAKVDLAIERSVNIYGEPGYMIDGKNEKYEGTIVILFQQLDVYETGEVLPEYEADHFGQKVYVKYLNDKGKKRMKSFDAADEGHFCLPYEGGEDCYYGLKVKGEALKKLTNADDWKFRHSYYYYLLKKYEDVMLLQDPVESEKFVIKIPSEAKGQMIDERKGENLAKKLGEYLSDCKELSDDLLEGEFDVKTKDNLLQIVEEYHQCKK